MPPESLQTRQKHFTLPQLCSKYLGERVQLQVVHKVYGRGYETNESGQKIVAKRRRSGHRRVCDHAGGDPGAGRGNGPHDRIQCEQCVLRYRKQYFKLSGF